MSPAETMTSAHRATVVIKAAQYFVMLRQPDDYGRSSMIKQGIERQLELLKEMDRLEEYLAEGKRISEDLTLADTDALWAEVFEEYKTAKRNYIAANQ